MRRWLLPVVGPLAVIAILIYSLVELDRTLRNEIRDQPRFLIPFKEIEITAPAAIDRAQLLAEVKKLGEFPNQISLKDEDVGRQLHDAFQKHPWIREVVQVQSVGPHLRVR